ncbi:MAG TPA: CesT family type III secretion system chaperone [Ramlibacter sp.]|jgi:hypothetical protein|uniref:CesT family type III secretion system chaperone n=1 Tax=Ramlibacter sp. TaxID=1917967 RepID=UPI002D736FC0|nr:CesT family type III secretion system chaperone [Ramlibacter sp.]HZY20522.1 CesT family type III secretion system chaperone [Ramlibacter sp.]
MTRSPGAPATHSAVSAYAARHRLDGSALRSDGRLTLRFDGRYRVQLRPAADGRIAVVSRLLDLSGRPRADADEALRQLATLACGLLRQDAAALCIDTPESALVLQQVLPADTDVEQLESQLAAFVNALAFWTRACAPHAVSA